MVDNLRDTDGDGIPDLADTDSDNDGIPDEREAGTARPRDTDEDGRQTIERPTAMGTASDRFEAGDDPNAPRDTDGDSIPDYLDDDSDGNGITDVDERGQGDDPADFDGDGVADLLDTDDDNDGVSDAVEIGEDPSNPVISVEGGSPDYRNPCYPRTPIALSTRPVSQSDLVVALPEWIDADSAGPLSGDLPPVGEGCERPDLDAELVRRSAGLRYRNAEGTVLGATLARHLPADLDELPGWQQPIQFIETALAKARETGLVTQGPGARRLTIGGHPAATVSIQVVVPSTASEVVLETLASHLLADCFTNEEDQVVCPPRALLARTPPA